MSQDPHCIFCKIVAGQIPAKVVYEDQDFIVFHDIHPKAPLHLLIIPRLHIESLQQVTNDQIDLLGKMLVLAPKLAADNGSPQGFKTLINTGKAGGQEVYHLHMHVLGGFQAS
jgi:histidine triad (HIT) family protein